MAVQAGAWPCGAGSAGGVFRPVSRLFEGRFVPPPWQHLDVQDQLPHGFVEYGQVGRAESVVGGMPGGQGVTGRVGVPPRGTAGAATASEGAARGAVERPLGPETRLVATGSVVGDPLHTQARPLVEDPDLPPEPTRRPGPFPGLAGGRGLVGGPRRTVGRDRLARPMPAERASGTGTAYRRGRTKRLMARSRRVATGAGRPRGGSPTRVRRCRGCRAPAGTFASVAEHLVVDDST